MKVSSIYALLFLYTPDTHPYLFIPPIACSTTTRIEDITLLNSFSSLVSIPFGGLFLGICQVPIFKTVILRLFVNYLYTFV